MAYSPTRQLQCRRAGGNRWRVVQDRRGTIASSSPPADDTVVPTRPGCVVGANDRTVDAHTVSAPFIVSGAAAASPHPDAGCRERRTVGSHRHVDRALLPGPDGTETREGDVDRTVGGQRPRQRGRRSAEVLPPSGRRSPPGSSGPHPGRRPMRVRAAVPATSGGCRRVQRRHRACSTRSPCRVPTGRPTRGSEKVAIRSLRSVTPTAMTASCIEDMPAGRPGFCHDIDPFVAGRCD